MLATRKRRTLPMGAKPYDAGVLGTFQRFSREALRHVTDNFKTE